MLGSLYWNYWEDWQLFHRAIFDGANHLIYIDPSEDQIDVGVELYSDWKEWSQVRFNTKYLPAFRAVGGDPLPGGLELGVTYFLTNGWRIVVDHGIVFDGNLYTEEGDSPFITTGNNALSTNVRSNLVDFVDLSSLTPDTGIPADVELIKKVLTNRLEMDETSSGNHVLYDDDGTTPLLTWTVVDSTASNVQLPAGVPARRSTPS